MIAVEADRLSRHFGKIAALDAATFSVRAGTVFGLLGCNGAGKSTLIKLLAGHLKPSSGQAAVLGYDIARPDPRRWLRMGYVSQARHLPDWMTGEECLDFARSFRANWDRSYIAALAKRFEVPLGRTVESLSRGQYVRLQTCIALGHHPELVLLDEPTSGLDPGGRRELLSILIEEMERSGATVVMSSHLVEDLERLADTIAILDAGRIAACGPPEDLQRTRSRISLPMAAQLHDSELARLPGLLEFRRDGGATVAITGEPEDALAFLQARGLEDAACSIPSLQQLFLDTIQRRSQ